jgi:uncharacterized glyoxalase superfamily protein PhnB
MKQRIDFITLRVENLKSALHFYEQGLGWRPLWTVPGEVAFFQVAPGQVLSLFDADGFDEDVPGHADMTMTLAHNVDSEEAVRDLVAEMAAGGAEVLKPPVATDWGGYHATVRDPAGFGWEIAYNPGWSVDEDGTVRLGPVEE